MTRATEKPVRRVVISEDRFGTNDYVVEIRARTLTMRPVRTRRGGPQEIEVPFGALYLRAMIARVEATKRERKRRRARTL